MPVYEFICDECGKTTEEYFKADSIGKPECCGKPMRRIFTNPGMRIGFRAGYDIGAGKYFDTDKQRHEWMARRGVKSKR